MDTAFSFFGWTFLPAYATSILQSFYYKLTVPVGRAPPQPGTPLYVKHHRRIRVLVLTLYLVYTLFQSLYDVKVAGDFFTLLSVTPSTSDREIKSRFRRLAAKYHPDKLRADDTTGGPSSPTNDQDYHFLILKTAQDTLLSPPLRYAYTRFGPQITRVQSPTTPTIRNYVLAGLRYNLLPSYFMNIASLVAMNYLFLPKGGAYWRYLILSSIVVVEWYLITHSDAELASLNYVLPIQRLYGVLQSRTKLHGILPPHLLPYQILGVLRKLTISANIFISQIAPQLSSPSTSPSQLNYNPDPNSTSSILTRLLQNLTHLHQTALRTDAESTSLLQLQMAPFRGSSDSSSGNINMAARLREGMREGMVTGAIRQHPEVREAVERVVRTRREQQLRRQRQ